MPRAAQPTKPSSDPSTGSVWTRPQRSRREQPALSRDQIVAEAIALLDSDGIEALSMRKLGTRLNAGATSLYTHVSNKDELIELVVDRVYGEIEVPKPASRAEWRAAALECGNNVRAAILGHPWIASVLGEMGMSYLGPNMMRLSEDMLELFESGGFDLVRSETALKTIWSYVLGTAATEAAWLTALARSGQNEEEWVRQVSAVAVQAMEPYPRTRKLHAQLSRDTVDETRRSNFDLGLDCILDGLEAQRGK
ncbi:TetR/AcrR family transcriptional regulator [Streptomyces flavofungini]|uniref:TetR/AcrR family transcriptional regulator C-terminal domain-containing protein n=1 Tax=Streptomyces flavofungini TaxID=68200 RepID=A0ABS0WXX5_9ACTN|nr:TetR/AcrR family transcriptional regulator [Streptomyces flavofungini]MBJ3805788.1 TetR/AcrR family transcriptional regulator C-terminal domain-containing protein [Streptomyces flavofungini]GHC71739.1 TetR family transcriptional regulator [Streptomyces flavofungini]